MPPNDYGDYLRSREFGQFQAERKCPNIDDNAAVPLAPFALTRLSTLGIADPHNTNDRPAGDVDRAPIPARVPHVYDAIRSVLATGVNTWGGATCINNLRNRSFRVIAQKAGLSITLHGLLRTTVATVARENGAELADLKALLGHTSEKTTERNYVKATARQRARAVQVMERIGQAA